MTARFAGWHGLPRHLWIEPDRQRPATHERYVMGGPVPGLVGGVSVCSCTQATQLNSQDESLTGLEKQSHGTLPHEHPPLWILAGPAWHTDAVGAMTSQRSC
jgi:hypothetical protein